MELAQKLVDFANTLDTNSLQSFGDEVDSVTRNLLKTAQYVGVQGYWVRNERCWSNCYRQKRASKPSLSAQEVWFECQSEFQKSLNNNGSKWDKYAENNEIVKTAEYKQDQEYFSQFIKTANVPAVDAIDMIVSGNIQTAYIDAASALSSISDKLSPINKELAKTASDLSEEVVKTAWSLKDTGDLWRGIRQIPNAMIGTVRGWGSMSGAISNIKDSTKSLQAAWAGISQSITGYNTARTELVSALDKIVNNKNSRPDAKQLATNASKALNMMPNLRLNSPQYEQIQQKIIQQLNALVGQTTAGPSQTSRVPASAAAPAANPSAPQGLTGAPQSAALAAPTNTPAPTNIPAATEQSIANRLKNIDPRYFEDIYNQFKKVINTRPGDDTMLTSNKKKIYTLEKIAAGLAGERRRSVRRNQTPAGPAAGPAIEPTFDANGYPIGNSTSAAPAPTAPTPTTAPAGITLEIIMDLLKNVTTPEAKNEVIQKFNEILTGIERSIGQKNQANYMSNNNATYFDNNLTYTDPRLVNQLRPAVPSNSKAHANSLKSLFKLASFTQGAQ